MNLNLNHSQTGVDQSDLLRLAREEYLQGIDRRSALEAYLPASVLNLLAKNPEPFRSQYSETFKAAIIFLDISGFTMLCARLAELGDAGPEIISKHLNAYFGSLIETAAQYGGELVKSAGDAILCMFREQPNEFASSGKLSSRGKMSSTTSIPSNGNGNDSIPSSNSSPSREGVDLDELALRAVQCGLEIQEHYSSYDSGEGFVLTLHIGIAVGNISFMILGGVNQQWMPLITGEPLAQLATCVENSNSGQVVVSPLCYRLIENRVNAVPQGTDYLIQGMKRRPLKMKSNLTPSSGTRVHSPGKVPLYIPQLPASSEAALRSLIHPAVLSRLDQSSSSSNNHQLHLHHHQMDELRNITSIFVKLMVSDDTKRGGDLQPELFCCVLQETFHCMQEQVIKREGMVCQFLNDDKGVILFAAFGVPPFSHADDPFRAIKTAVSIRKGLEELGAKCSIGVCSGFVFTGVVGSKQRHDYTVLGDTVNMSARLMAKAHDLGVGILCDEATFEACHLRIDFDHLEPVLVKGKPTPMKIYSPKKSAKSHKPVAAPTSFNIVGRDEEKLLLTQYTVQLNEHYSLGVSHFLGNNSDQLARTIILEGQPGIGKSFLAQYAVRVATQIGVTIAEGQTKAVHQLTPFYIWKEVIRSLYGMDSCTPSELRSKLEDLRKSIDSRLVEYLPLLNNIITLPFSQEELSSVDMSEKNPNYLNRISELIKFVIEYKSCQNPVVMVLEDLQWMDIPSMRVLTDVALSVHSVLIIATSRELSESQAQYLNGLFALDRTHHLFLEPLSKSDCATILCKRLNLEILPPELEPCLEQLQGNPLFCEEFALGIANSITTGIKLTELASSMSVPSQPSTSPGKKSDPTKSRRSTLVVPNSVEGLIGSRLDLLPVSAQTLLKTASVIGFEFSLGLLQEMNSSAKTIPVDIKCLVDHNFIYQGSPTSYLFRSEAACKIAYSRLLVSQRRELHRKIAEWYETQNPPGDEEQYYPILAHHWFAALENQSPGQVDVELVHRVLKYLKHSIQIASQYNATQDLIVVLHRGIAMSKLLPPKESDLASSKFKLRMLAIPIQDLRMYSNPQSTRYRLSINSALVSSQGDSVPQSPSTQGFLPQTTDKRTRSRANTIQPPSTATGGETVLQGQMRLKRALGGRWKSVYCNLKNSTFRVYSGKEKLKSNKPRVEVDLRFASIRTLPRKDSSDAQFVFTISRRNHAELVLSVASEVELQYWISALSAYSSVPSISINVDAYTDTAMVVATDSGKIEHFNRVALELFGYSIEEVVGENLSLLIPNDKLLQQYIKKQNRDLIGKPRRITCNTKTHETGLVVCFGEYHDSVHYKLLASFKREMKLPPELEIAVNYESPIEKRSQDALNNSLRGSRKKSDAKRSSQSLAKSKF